MSDGAASEALQEATNFEKRQSAVPLPPVPVPFPLQYYYTPSSTMNLPPPPPGYDRLPAPSAPECAEAADRALWTASWHLATANFNRKLGNRIELEKLGRTSLLHAGNATDWVDNTGKLNDPAWPQHCSNASRARLYRYHPDRIDAAVNDRLLLLTARIPPGANDEQYWDGKRKDARTQQHRSVGRANSYRLLAGALHGRHNHSTTLPGTQGQWVRHGADRQAHALNDDLNVASTQLWPEYMSHYVHNPNNYPEFGSRFM